MKNTILIVDDDDSALETLCALLDGLQYHLELATNGLDALEKASWVEPDLILLDVMMPGMSGYEVCRQLRETPTLREVPILLLTALDDRESRLQGLRAGADDFISKPLDLQELRARVNTILRLNRYRTLLEQRENLKDLATRVVRAQEDERQRISRELHDDIGQSLTAQQIQLQLVSDRIPESNPALKQDLQSVIADTAQTFSRLRQLAQELRPPLLDTMSVGQALQAYCADYSRRTSLVIHFDADETTLEIPDPMKVTMYRVLQEALANISRHAHATQSWVTLNMEEDELCLTIQDDGQGIMLPDRSHKGLGLQGMLERATLVGGRFHLKSSPGKGTIITVRFVMNPAIWGGMDEARRVEES